MWGNIIAGGLVLFCLLVLVAVNWAKAKTYWPFRVLTGRAKTVADSTAAAIQKLWDTSSAMAAYESLTAIRKIDSVEADPRAIEACDYLRGVITAWKRPEQVAASSSVSVTSSSSTAAVAPTVDGGVATLKTGETLIVKGA